MDEPESYKNCKLSLSLSLLKALSFYPHAKMQISPFEVEVVCTEFIGKMISHQWESNAIRSPLIMKHMYLLRSFAPSTASAFKIGSYKFLAEWGSVYWLTAYCISMPPSLLARFIKNAVPSPISHGPYS